MKTKQFLKKNENLFLDFFWNFVLFLEVLEETGYF